MEKKKEHIGDPIVTFFNIVFVALIGWNTYCTYWWSKISSVQKQSAFIKVKDFPEFLPQSFPMHSRCGELHAIPMPVPVTAAAYQANPPIPHP